MPYSCKDSSLSYSMCGSWVGEDFAPRYPHSEHRLAELPPFGIAVCHGTGKQHGEVGTGGKASPWKRGTLLLLIPHCPKQVQEGAVPPCAQKEVPWRWKTEPFLEGSPCLAEVVFWFQDVEGGVGFYEPESWKCIGWVILLAPSAPKGCKSQNVGVKGRG